MELIELIVVKSFMLTTDEKEWSEYERIGEGIFLRNMNGSWEETESEELEKLFQAKIKITGA